VPEEYGGAERPARKNARPPALSAASRLRFIRGRGAEAALRCGVRGNILRRWLPRAAVVPDFLGDNPPQLSNVSIIMVTQQ
jgi:hypothetical protein